MKICVDAGHNYSGGDTGAVGVGGLKEQDITFAIADKLREALIANGHQVVMTRNNLTDNLGTDASSSLRERVRIANNNRCDFFISIHCNSGVAIANGTEVLISARGGVAESYANAVQDAIVNRMGTMNRGVRVDTEYLGIRLYVLHNTNCPAILIETGFISNNDDAAKLNEQPEDFALAIASAFGARTEESRFTDTDEHWAKIHIDKLEAYGIVNGYEDGTFRPDEPITRGEAAAMVSNALSVLGK
ncbi:MAG: N-acetylmuramoyl-L-alanine amidase [Clostridia bacterium]|nr:N-acetylmuramoyl-L-alanine amidase [Clostridia bacterium]